MLTLGSTARRITYRSPRMAASSCSPPSASNARTNAARSPEPARSPRPAPADTREGRPPWPTTRAGTTSRSSAARLPLGARWCRAGPSAWPAHLRPANRGRAQPARSQNAWAPPSPSSLASRRAAAPRTASTPSPASPRRSTVISSCRSPRRCPPASRTPSKSPDSTRPRGWRPWQSDRGRPRPFWHTARCVSLARLHISAVIARWSACRIASRGCQLARSPANAPGHGLRGGPMLVATQSSHPAGKRQQNL
jgi:hypothetical protein